MHTNTCLSTQLCMHMHICVMYPYATSMYLYAYLQYTYIDAYTLVYDYSIYCRSDQSFFVCVCSRAHTNTQKNLHVPILYPFFGRFHC